MNRLHIGIAVILASLSFLAVADNTVTDTVKPFHGSREEGWFWYQDPEPPKPVEEQPVVPQPAVPPAAPKSEALQAFDKFKQSIEDAKNTMIAVPSPENVRHYVELQTKLVKRSSEVADAFQRVVWANPQFDFTQERPVVNTGLRVYEQAQQETKRQTFERLANNNVFYFFFRGDCPYCHAFAPVLLGFAQATGIKIFPISVDGGGLPEFPQPHKDNGIADRLGVNMVPALFLATPATGDIVPVGFGALSATELEERLVAIANPAATKSVMAATPTHQLPGMPPL